MWGIIIHMTKESASNPVIYQATNGAIELSVDAGSETIWATQKQIADVSGGDMPILNECRVARRLRIYKKCNLR
jgi:hypothetical protein